MNPHSIKIQHHCIMPEALNPSKSNTMCKLHDTEPIKTQQNQLLEFDGFGVVRVNAGEEYLIKISGASLIDK